MEDSADLVFMRAALDLAAKGVGKTSPNPAVGCVIVKDGAIAGRGWHKKAGMPHAEAEALAEAGERARGATVYVTLEPCSHHGRTPPCADALIAAGVKRVVCAMEDPNPLVAGRGSAKLKDAGIEVKSGLLSGEAALLNEGFCLSVVAKRPFVHLKLAATLDGKIASKTGDSKWVTGEEARRRVHELRRRCGAVMVGVGTANADDPKLTARLGGEETQTQKFIIDRDLRLNKSLWLARPLQPGATTVFCCGEADRGRESELADQGLNVVRTGSGREMDLRAVLEYVYSLGRMEILIEGGSRVAYEFLRVGLVDRCHFFYSPRILGGDGFPMFGGEGPERIDGAVKLRDIEVSRAGDDIYVTGRVGGR